MPSKRVCKSTFPVVPSGTLFNFSDALVLALSSASINLSNSAFSLGLISPSLVISVNLLSTACLASSAASIASCAFC
nr:hypothetical protein [Staphylococcus xylosus]